MNPPLGRDHGPYAVHDLDALPEDGKGYELADGWLVELSLSPRHGHAADRLKELVRDAARRAGADVYVSGCPSDVATAAGIRKPDMFAVPKDAAHDAISHGARTYPASGLVLVAEVISPQSASEQADRVQKAREYASAGIPVYWIVDLDPLPAITVLTLRDGAYTITAEVRAGEGLSVSEPFTISFDPSALTDLG